MKKIKTFIKSLCEQPVFSGPVLALTRIFSLKSYEERIMKIRAEHKYFKNANYGKTVLRGPFKGMEYPTLRATGSELAPKILGSYESELFPAVEEICRKDYDTVLDIGCAEGYYAVGLALRLPAARVYAFDTDTNALKLCRSLAEINGVSERLQTEGFCTAETLQDFHFGRSGVLVCDCEGYEARLFTKENIKNLENVDLLIELHDTASNLVSAAILPLFNTTHYLKIIKTKKRDPSLYPELEKFSVTEQQIILSECRGTLLGEPSQEWAYLSAIKVIELQNPHPAATAVTM